MEIDPRRQERARQYARLRRRLFVAELGIGGLYLLAMLVGSGSERLKIAATALSPEIIVVVGLYFVVLDLGYAALLFPLSLFGGFVLPTYFGLSTQRFVSWLFDWAKGICIALVFGLVLIEILYYFLTTMPAYWWLAMSLIILLFTVVLSNLAPIVLVPLFYRLTPLKDRALAQSLVRMAERSRTSVRGVWVMNLSSKTTAANAALMGLGNTRRIVLGDTLLDRYDSDEIETIFAHELGHHVHADIPKMIAEQSIVTLVGLYVVDFAASWTAGKLGYSSLADVAMLPLLALVFAIFALFALPIANTFSRSLERQADEYALEFTGKAQAFKQAMIKLANQNLAELDPAGWVEFVFYDHPSVGKRIRLAEHFALVRQSGNALPGKHPGKLSGTDQSDVGGNGL